MLDKKIQLADGRSKNVITDRGNKNDCRWGISLSHLSSKYNNNFYDFYDCLIFLWLLIIQLHC